MEVTSREYVKVSELVEWERVRESLVEAGLSAEDLDRKVASVRVKAHKAE